MARKYRIWNNAGQPRYGRGDPPILKIGEWLEWLRDLDPPDGACGALHAHDAAVACQRPAGHEGGHVYGLFVSPDGAEGATGEPDGCGCADYGDGIRLCALHGGAGPAPPPPPETVLQEAQRLVYGDRERTYGHPRDDFRRTALRWRAHVLAKYDIDIPFDVLDVSMMQSDVKRSRLDESPLHRDSHTDLAGYAGAGARAVGVDS